MTFQQFMHLRRNDYIEEENPEHDDALNLYRVIHKARMDQVTGEFFVKLAAVYNQKFRYQLSEANLNDYRLTPYLVKLYGE